MEIFVMLEPLYFVIPECLPEYYRIFVTLIIYSSLRDFGLLLRCNQGLHSCGMLHGGDWYKWFITDVLGQHIGPIFKDEAKCTSWTVRPSMVGPMCCHETSVTLSLGRVTSQKSDGSFQFTSSEVTVPTAVTKVTYVEKWTLLLDDWIVISLVMF